MLLLGLATTSLLVLAVLLALVTGATRRVDLATITLAYVLLVVVVLLKILLLCGWFRPGAVAGSVVGLCLAAAVAVRRVPRLRTRAAASWAAVRAPRRSRGGLRVLVPVMLPVVAVYTYRAVMAVRLPPMDMDSLWYHLPPIAAWVRTGSLSPSIENLSTSSDLGWTVVSDTYPRDFELSAAWIAVFDHSVEYVQLTQIGYAVLLCTATYGICRRLGAARGLAGCGAAAVVLAPAVTGQAYLMYADVARAAVPAAVFHLLLVAVPDRDRAPRTGVLLLAGAMLGVAAGIKASNVYFVPAAAVTLWLLARPRRWRSLALFAAATAATGAFWYALTWIRWGSPVWPVALGPFDGPMTADQMVDVQRPEQWRDLSDVDIMLRSWWGAVSRFGRSSWYAEFTGQLGLAWLFLFLPAVVAVLLLPLWPRARRTLARPAYAVVLPFTAATLAAPGQWFSRYTIPLLTAGAVAFAVLLQALARASRPRVRRPLVTAGALALAGTTALGLAPGLMWSNFTPEEDPAHRTYRDVVQALGRPDSVRDDYGVWGLYPGLDELPAGTRIGFCEEDTVRWYTPMLLVGRDFDRILVDLGHCGDLAGARALMDRHRVGHLYLSDGSALGAAALAGGGAEQGLRVVVAPLGPDPADMMVRVWGRAG